VVTGDHRVELPAGGAAEDRVSRKWAFDVDPAFLRVANRRA